MDRREFLSAATLSLLAAPLAVEAQPTGKVFRIGVLSPGSAQGSSVEMAALWTGLREVGYVDGQNIHIDWQFAEGSPQRLHELAAELVRLKPDVILTINTQAAVVAKSATSTIPIVFVRAGDPTGAGLVPSLARPGGNVTGLASFVAEMGPKRLELLKQAIPRLSRVAVLWNSQNRGAELVFNELKAAGPRLGVNIQDARVRGQNELAGVFDAAAEARVGALVVADDLVIDSYRTEILALAAKNRLGVASVYREYANAGGLMAYGPSLSDTYRRAATYVDRIFRGANPADLPIQQPAKFDFVINLKTAKALGLIIPPAVLARADEVIQ